MPAKCLAAPLADNGIHLDYSGLEGAMAFHHFVAANAGDLHGISSIRIAIQSDAFDEFQDDMYAAALRAFVPVERRRGLRSLTLHVDGPIAFTRHDYVVSSPVASVVEQERRPALRLFMDRNTHKQASELEYPLSVRLYEKAIVRALLDLRGVPSVSVTGSVHPELRSLLVARLASASSSSGSGSSTPDVQDTSSISSDSSSDVDIDSMVRIMAPQKPKATTSDTLSSSSSSSAASSFTYDDETGRVAHFPDPYRAPTSRGARIVLGWLTRRRSTNNNGTARRKRSRDDEDPAAVDAPPKRRKIAAIAGTAKKAAAARKNSTTTTSGAWTAAGKAKSVGAVAAEAESVKKVTKTASKKAAARKDSASTVGSAGIMAGKGKSAKAAAVKPKTARKPAKSTATTNGAAKPAGADKKKVAVSKPEKGANDVGVLETVFEPMMTRRRAQKA